LQAIIHTFFDFSRYKYADAWPQAMDEVAQR
jgi:hypothetical protein